MIVSTLLKKQMTKFLGNAGITRGIGLCLVDENFAPIVSTNGFRLERIAGGTARDGFPMKAVGSKRNLGWKLLADSSSISAAPAVIGDVLDSVAGGLDDFIDSESEMQSLSEELLERYQELHILYDAIEDVGTVFDEGEICSLILRKALQSLGVQRGAVVLKDGPNLVVRDRQQAKNAAGTFDDAEFIDRAGEVVASGKHLILEESQGVSRALLAVPINSNRRPIGALVVAGKSGAEMFTSVDRISLSALAGYLGVAVNASRLVAKEREAEGLRREVEFASKVQQNLLPAEMPHIRGLHAAAFCHPSAGVGGDFYGFLRLDEHRWAFAVADVAGHGLGAAFIMASLRSILRSEARAQTGVARLLESSNLLLNDDAEASDVYATVFIGVYSETDRTLTYSNAGHPPPFVWSATTGRLKELDKGGAALGLFRDEKYEEEQIHLHDGDILVIFTDGITEARSPEDLYFEDERLQEVVRTNAARSADEIREAVAAAVEEFQRGGQNRDDMTLLVLKVNTDT